MKKRIILPITLAALMMVGTACGSTSKTGPTTEQTATTTPTTEDEGGTTTSTTTEGGDTTTTSTSEDDVVVNSVTISNKAALTAEWFAGENRRIGITADPAIEDLDAAMEEGLIEISSDNPEVVSVMGLMLMAKKGGSATITVAYGGKSDTVTVTIVDNSPIGRYGTVHAGTEEDPFDNADAVLAAPKAVAASDTTKYYIKGIVKSFYHAVGERTDGVVSWFIEDKDGNQGFECYKCLKEDGSSLTNDDIWVGAEIVVKGALTVYNGTCETDTCVFVENTGEGAPKPAAQQTITSNVADAVTAGLALADGASSYDKYQITGYITKASGSNFWIDDTKGSTAEDTAQFQLYLAYFNGKYIGPDGNETTMADGMLVGAKVQITTTIKNYHGQVETGVIDGNITILETGTAATAIKATVAEAIAAGKALEAGAISEETYEVTGYVVKVGTWSTQYNNGDVFIADAKGESDATKQLQVFRIKDKTIFDKCTVDTKIATTSQLTRYVQYNTSGEPSSGIKKEVIETTEGPKVVILEQSDGGGGTETTTVKATVTEALAVGNALEAGATTTETYEVTGYVVRLGTWSTQHGNGDAFIADSKDETDATKQLQLFRINDKAVFDQLVAGTTKVSATAPLTHYVEYNTKGDATSGIKKDIVETTANPVVKVLEGGNLPDDGGGTEGGETETTNYGTVDAPLTVTQALAVASAECAKSGDFTAQQVYVKGIVKETPDYSGSYIKTFYLKDDTNEVMVYSCNKTTGVANPDQNDEVILHGYITNYSGTIEFSTYNKSVYVTLDANTRGTSTISVASTSSADATVTLDATSGTNGSDFTFSVAAASGKKVTSVKVNGANATYDEGTGKYTGTIHGNTTVKVETADEGAAEVLTESMDLTGGYPSGSSAAKKHTFAGTVFSLTVEQGSSTSVIRENATDGHIRIYKSYKVAIGFTAGYKIEKVVVDCDTSDSKYVSAWTGSTFNAGVTCTAEGGLVTLTPGTDGTISTSALSNQSRVKSMTVYYTVAE